MFIDTFFDFFAQRFPEPDSGADSFSVHRIVCGFLNVREMRLHAPVLQNYDLRKKCREYILHHGHELFSLQLPH